MVIGVTGGIGSGKTTVSRIFEGLGAFVIDADQIGREVVEEEPEVRRKLTAVFGQGILNPDGTLRRRELGRLAFASIESRDKLNAIVHPSLLRRLREAISRALEEAPHRPIVVDAALIVEWGITSEFDALVVVVTDVELLKERLLKRGGLSLEEIEDRVRSQLPVEEKIKLADYVIHNDEDVHPLRQRLLEVWKFLQAVKPERCQPSQGTSDV